MRRVGWCFIPVNLADNIGFAKKELNELHQIVSQLLYSLPMLTLGIETSCDETGFAIVENGKKILSNRVFSQSPFHAPHGGVVPELASRHHVEHCPKLLEEALVEAGVTLNEIDLIAVAQGPGLLGSLLVGVNFAKGLALALQKPLVGVNHVEAHLFAPFMTFDEIPLPALGVVVSGGHTAILVISAWGEFFLVGETQDDAIGEAFDKVASILDLPYPGGPEIEKLARIGDPTKFCFPQGKVKGRPFDLSFSGLKTSVLYTVKGQNGLKSGPSIIAEEEKKDIAAAFQKTALKNIVEKSVEAAKMHRCKSVVVGGGVSVNDQLRTLFLEAFSPVFFPPKSLSLDNGAMIAGLGFFQYSMRKSEDYEGNYAIEPFPRFLWN